MNIRVKQRDRADCGAACLASVARFYKLSLPVSRIRQNAGTDREGTSMAGLIEAATKMGFQASGVRAKPEALNQVPLPAIAHLIKANNMRHYVVIVKLSNTSIKVMDPTDGKLHTLLIGDFRKEWSGVLLLLLPNADFTKAGPGTTPLSYFLNLMKPHRSILLQAVFGALVYTILGLSTAIFVQKIVDFVLVDNNPNLLNLMGMAMIIIFVIQQFIGTVKTIYTLKTGQLIDARLILGYYTHVLKLPQSFFDTMRIGEISSRLNDAVKIRIFINDVSINLLVNFFMFLFSFLLMFTYYWKLALFMFLVIPLYVLVYILTNFLNRKVQRTIMEEGAELEAQLVEILGAVGTIKRFGLEEYANLRTEIKFLKLLKTVYKSGLNSVFSSTSAESISQILTIALLWIGAGLVLQLHISPGELLSFYTLVGYFTCPVSSFIEMNKVIQDAMIAADRLFEIMDLEKEADQDSDDLILELKGSIRFENVYFRYGTRKPVFENLNLEIPLGKLTAIIGDSGSGKSTLMSVMQHLYPIQSGKIDIAETPLHYIPNKTLRRMIAVVPQQIDLFSANIIENIAIGDPKPDFSRVMKICYQLAITDFIESLPEGFYTRLGENGATLSGGQKQRIAIARAIYRNPEILILDEPTSALDPGSEEQVKKSIDDLVRNGKTVIVVSHRLSMVRNAALIIAIKNGRVAEQGTHQELLAARAVYWNLWKQNLREIPDQTLENNQSI